MIQKGIIILSILITQSSCAPYRCIESCTAYHKANLNEHANLVQAQSNTKNINYLNVNYDRPDNWTEQNEYRTDDGLGKVHEEQGQYIDGSRHVRYFKKNYTSSYSTIHASNPDLLQQEQLNNQARHNSMQTSNGQRLYAQSRNIDSYKQEQTYNNLHSSQLQQLYRGRESHNERLENFSGLSEGTQMSQHGISNDDSEILQGQNQYIEQRPGNWSNVNAYRTDGGHGHVFEVEGQYVTGPKKVRYYRKNYTSHYSTNNNPEHDITSTNIHNLQNEMENLNQEFQNFEKAIYQQSHSKHLTSSNTLNRDTIHLIPDNLTPTSGNYDLQVAESINHRQRLENEYSSPLGRITHIPVNYLTNRKISNINEQNIDHQRQETYTSQYHTNVSPNQIRVSNEQNNGYQRYLDNKQITEQQRTSDNYQRLNEEISIYPRTSGQIRHYEEHWNTMGQREGQGISNQYERGQYSSHNTNQQYTEGVMQSRNNYHPQNTMDLNQLVTDTVGLGHDLQHTDCTHERQQIQYGYNRKYKRNADYSKYSENLHQKMSQQTTDHIDFGQQTQQLQKPSRYNSHNQQVEDLAQQNEDLNQQTSGFDDLTQQTTSHLEFGQQTQQSQKPGRYTGHNQQVEGLSQQAGGFDDFDQQMTGHLEFGQQTQQSQKPGRYTDNNQQVEDLTQQNQDLTQQTGEFEDLTQQTAGYLDFGQQTQQSQKPGRYTVHNHQVEGLSQQADGSDDLSQQTTGHLEFGQQTQQSQKPGRYTSNNQQVEDLTQQISGSDDLSQQTTGHLEFGQQTQQSQKPGRYNSHNLQEDDLTQQHQDLTQQTGEFEDLTQQTTGHLEFGQQTQQSQKPGRYTVHNQQVEGLSQQADGSDDLSQQTTGHLEFGQQTQQSQKPGRYTSNNQQVEDLTQQNQDLTQQTGEFEDLTQQTAGHLDFGQQTQQSQKPGRYTVHNHQVEGLSQQADVSDDLSQQTTGHLEFGQQTQQSQKPGRNTSNNQQVEDLTQQNQDLTQQTGEFEDLTQQTAGHLEFGQQTQQSQKPGRYTVHNQQVEGLSQQADGSDDLSQQTTGHLEFGQQTQQSQKPGRYTSNNQQVEDLTQQNQDLTQQTGEFEDLTQQTAGHLEFGQQTQQSQNRHISHNKQGEDLTQQGVLHDLTHQIKSHLEFGQQTQQSQKPDRYTNHNLQVEDLSQQAGGFDDLGQQTTGYLEFGRQTQKSQILESHKQEVEDSNGYAMNPHKSLQLVTPAPKPRWQPRYHAPIQVTTDDVRNSNPYIYNPSKIYNDLNEIEQLRGDQVLIVPAPGIQSENGFNSISRQNNLDAPKIQPDDQSQQHTMIRKGGFTKGGHRHRYVNQQLSAYSSHSSNYNYGNRPVTESQISIDSSQFLFNQNLAGVQKNLNQEESQKIGESQNNNQQEVVTQDTNLYPKIDPRIIEVYGGPYNANHSDDIYKDVATNPSAILPPIVDGSDSWDIFDKPREVVPLSTTTTVIPETTEVIITEAPPSFWGKIAHKITNTFDKAKEKAKDLFG